MISQDGQTNGEAQLGKATVKVIGVGGGGSNAVSRMYRERIEGVEYMIINTDAQHLLKCDVPTRVRIGDKLTRGLGVGGDPAKGAEAAEESREELYEVVRGADMVFLATGMGGGTGTGACPVVAEIAKETGALTIAMVTKPFSFEGHKRRKQAEDGIQRLKERVDSLVVIANDKLLEMCGTDITADAAFRMADDVLRQGVQSIAEMVSQTGTINLDFADIKAIMGGAGPAWMAIGTGRGDNRAAEAARAAISSPMLEGSIDGAKGVLFNVTGGNDLTLNEVHAAAQVIEQVVDPNANIIFGMVNDPKMEDEVKVTIIATGFSSVESLLPREDSLFSQLEMNSANDSDTLDVPPFLRRVPVMRRKGH